MEIDVGEESHSVMDNVETVEVVASGDDIPVAGSSVGGALIDQHMIITNPDNILVSTSEVIGYLLMFSIILIESK